MSHFNLECAIFVNGVQDAKITSGGLLKIKMLLFSGKMASDELEVEFVLIKTNSHLCDPIIISIQRIESREIGVLTYIAEYQIEDTGFYSYGVRVQPYNPMLFRKQDAGLVYWG